MEKIKDAIAVVGEYNKAKNEVQKQMNDYTNLKMQQQISQSTNQ